VTIGEVAQQAGLQTSAIRYYERVGILPKAARQSGRRQYGPEVLDLLALVKFARGVGFSISEVRTLFGQRAEANGVSERWEALANHKLRLLDYEVTRIRAAQQLLSAVLKCRCLRPQECGSQIRAHAKALYPEEQRARPNRAKPAARLLRRGRDLRSLSRA
jgi:MerR family transcriptional regulator, redox-sensitive transcriptional activator SoxR